MSPLLHHVPVAFDKVTPHVVGDMFRVHMTGFLLRHAAVSIRESRQKMLDSQSCSDTYIAYMYGGNKDI